MQDLLKIFISPGAVFSSLKQEIKISQPLLALLLCVVVLTGAQPLFISDQAFIDQTEESIDSGLSFLNRLGDRFLGEEAMDEIEREINEEAEAEGTTIEELMDEAIAVGTSPEELQVIRITSAIFSPISALIWLGLGVVVLTTYFNIAGNSVQTRRPWADWFGFTLWSLMPVALFYLLFLIATIITGEVLPRSYLAPLAWLPGLQENAFAINLTFGMIWAMWIQTMGLQQWLDRPIPICGLIVLFPWAAQWLIASGMVELFKAV